MLKPIVLAIIKICKALFYNTPVHRSKIVNIVYEKLFHAAYGDKELVRVEYEGCQFDIPTRDITILPSLLNGDYEKFEIGLIRQVLKPGMTFIDVGANIGLFSTIASKCVGNNGNVIAFEPEPSNFALLKKNLRLNSITNVQAHSLAVGNVPTSLDLNLEDNSIGTHSLLDKSSRSFNKKIRVEVVRLDDFLERTHADVMKIDVEGFEPFVLQGAKETLGDVQYVLFEYNRKLVEECFSVKEYRELIQSFPYLYAVDSRKKKVRSFHPSELNKVDYLNIFAAKQEIQID